MKNLKFVVLAAALAVAPACKKKADNTPTAGSGSAVVATGSGSAMVDTGSGSAVMDVGSGSAVAMGSGSDSGSGSGSAAPAGPIDTSNEPGDWIKVYATHVEAKPNDPVEVTWPKLTVKKAKFDAANLEGGTATLTVDLASLKTDSMKRDDHLRTADYLDTSKFTTATIDISDVKKTADNAYTANAKVSLRDKEKTIPVTFNVTNATDGAVTIKGEGAFTRGDFSVGGQPDKGVNNDLKVKLQVTLKNT